MAQSFVLGAGAKPQGIGKITLSVELLAEACLSELHTYNPTL